MNEAKLRAKLERALATKISEAEWWEVKEDNVLFEFESGDLSWSDFRGLVEE